MNGNTVEKRPRRRRRWIFFVVFAVAVLVFFTILMRGPQVKPGTVVVLDLDQDVPERSAEDLIHFLGAPEVDLVALTYAMERAAMDERVDGILLRIGSTNPGAGKVEEIRGILEVFRRSGKFVVAYASGPDTLGYLLATAADEIILDPSTTLDAVGIQVKAFFLKDLFKELGVEADLVRVGEFKGDFEQLTLSAPTPEFESSMDALVDSLYQTILDGIAGARNLSTTSVRELLDRCPMLPDEAVAEKLVDRVLRGQDVKGRIDQRAARSVELMPIEDYVQAVGEPTRSDRHIAVIHVLGAIHDGDSRDLPLIGFSTGGDTVAHAIKESAKDPSVAGILLRIDSPGGTVTGSQKIFHAVDAAKKQKPVVASMGNIAASGGYYAACDADHIFAQRSTLTGSIGIYGGKIVVEALMERFHLESRSYSRGKRATMYDPTRRFTPEEQLTLKDVLENYYRRFVADVAAGRKKGFEEIQAVAQGRVWTGKSALEEGLVDSLGGLSDAAEALRRLTRVQEPLPLRVYPPKAGFLDIFRRSKRQDLVRLGASTPALYREVQECLEGSGLLRPFTGLALLPFALDIR